MRGIRVILGQQIVEAVFGTFPTRFRNIYSSAPQTRGPDRNQQSLNGLASFVQIAYACFDQILAR